MIYTQINILDMMTEVGEDRCKTILSHFSCPLNYDVEDFIRNKAIGFAQQKVAITFLVYAENKRKQEFVGYYTLANKFMSLTNSKISNSLRKRILKFAQYDMEIGRYLLSMPLIAQLGRNYDPAVNAYIPGAVLLDLACKKVMEAQDIIGGKTVYIECADNPKLYEFYSNNEFYEFGKREKDNGEVVEGKNLVQMLRYLKQASVVVAS